MQALPNILKSCSLYLLEPALVRNRSTHIVSSFLLVPHACECIAASSALTGASCKRQRRSSSSEAIHGPWPNGVKARQYHHWPHSADAQRPLEEQSKSAFNFMQVRQERNRQQEHAT